MISDQRNPEILRQTFPIAVLPSQNPIWTAPKSNSSLCAETQASNGPTRLTETMALADAGRELCWDVQPGCNLLQPRKLSQCSDWISIPGGGRGLCKDWRLLERHSA